MLYYSLILIRKTTKENKLKVTSLIKWNKQAASLELLTLHISAVAQWSERGPKKRGQITVFPFEFRSFCQIFAHKNNLRDVGGRP